jgi:hypothetical protein
MWEVQSKQKPPAIFQLQAVFLFDVVRSGLEPELFWTKTRRVANYTIGQFPQSFNDRAAKIINKRYTQNLF